MTSQDQAFHELARRLEPDLVRSTRDLRAAPPPHPMRAAAVTALAVLVVVLVLGGSMLLGAYAAGIVASVVGLVEYARTVAGGW